MGILSKSDYLIFRDCKKNAWLKIHRRDIYNQGELSEFDKAIIETGNEVDEYARQLFPGGVLIQGRNQAAQELTRNLIANKTPVLFQPSFLHDEFFAALDILEYDPVSKGYLIYEVKSSSGVKEDTHLSDLAFQCVLLEKIGVPVRKAHIIHLNSHYVRSGELNVRQLFTIKDVTDKIWKLKAHTDAEMQLAHDYLSRTIEPVGNCDCMTKGRSSHCTTFAYSNPDVPAYGIHDIARIGTSKAKLSDWTDSGIFRLEDLPTDAALSEIQQKQVDAYVLDRPLIDKPGILSELCRIDSPIYFLDYETCPAAIPRFDGFSPYQQIPFQYSLHILEADGAVHHEEFLSTTPGDPSAALCASLKSHIGDRGSVVVWNKKFEKGINTQLAERIPAEKAFLDSINSRMYDLMDVFSKQHYVHKGFKGGTSIKDVLPVVAPELSYKDLVIQEGGTASQAWDKITSDQITPQEREATANHLKLYCERDTYAMYVVWRHLCGLTT
jgi:hypothetical protein